MTHKHVMIVDAFCLCTLLQAQRIAQFNKVHCHYPQTLCCLCCAPLPGSSVHILGRHNYPFTREMYASYCVGRRAWPPIDRKDRWKDVTKGTQKTDKAQKCGRAREGCNSTTLLQLYLLLTSATDKLIYGKCMHCVAFLVRSVCFRL